MKARAAFVAVVLGVSTPAVADDAAELAHDAAARLVEAAGLLEDAEGAADRIEALTGTVRAYEAGLSAMREGLRRAALREDVLREKLSDQDSEIAALLTLLQSVSRRAEGEALFHPGGAVQTIRAGTLTASLVPALQDRATALESDLAELEALIAVQTSGMATLGQGLDGIRDARLQLTDAVSSRGDLNPYLSTDAAAIEALINSAETLSAFADSLLPDQVRADWLGNSRWPTPVVGKILRRYNEADAAGVRRPGWIFATAPEALVTTPAAATVRFSGDVPGQGTVTILEPEPGALVILAGIGQSFVQRDQIVDAGDPIGLMGGVSPRVQENLNETFSNSGLFGGETLYMEIRQGRTPVDPAEILRLGEE